MVVVVFLRCRYYNSCLFLREGSIGLWMFEYVNRNFVFIIKIIFKFCGSNGFWLVFGFLLISIGEFF